MIKLRKLLSSILIGIGMGCVFALFLIFVSPRFLFLGKFYSANDMTLALSRLARIPEMTQGHRFIIGALVFVIVAIFTDYLIRSFYKKVESEEYDKPKTKVFAEFLKKIRFCYTIENLIDTIQNELEYSGDCSVMLVEPKENIVLYNSTSRFVSSPETFTSLNEITAEHKEGVYFFASDMKECKLKNARIAAVILNEIHFFIVCGYFNEVEPDLKNDYVDDEGNTRKRGKVIILDESDFKTFSFGEISSVIEKVDDKLGGKLDCVIVDYIQLCKFSGQGVTYDANSQINSYVTFFRRLAQNFKKEIKEDGTEEVRQLTMILLAQINRSSWQKASRNDGRYDITCLADANELERGSARVFTTYTSEDLKARKSAQVQILKNRAGQTMYDPVTVYADGEAYVFMSEDGMNSSFGGDGLASVESAFASMDDSFDFL